MQSFRMSVMSVVRRKEVPVILKSRCKILFDSVRRLWTRDPRRLVKLHNTNLQVVITNASPYVAVWTSIKYERNAQNAIYHAHLNILSLVI